MPGSTIAPRCITAKRPDHPLTRFKQISLSQLAYPIALPEPDTTVRQLFDITCSRQRLSFEPVLTGNYVGSLFGLLRHHENSVTIAGEISIRYQVERGEVAWVGLHDRGLDLRNIEVQTLTGHTLSSADQAFLERHASRVRQRSVEGDPRDGCQARGWALRRRTAPRIPRRISIGGGGQPGTVASTGITLATRPQLA